MKKRISILAVIAMALLSSCAESKGFIINGKYVVVEPYGWMDESEFKNDSVIYKVSTGNVVWSVIGVETVFVPVFLTGKSLYEPVKLKRDK